MTKGIRINSNDDPLFALPTAALGDIEVLRLTTPRLACLEIRGDDKKFLDSLLKAICRRIGQELRDEQIQDISQHERERLVDKYLETDNTLLYGIERIGSEPSVSILRRATENIKDSLSAGFSSEFIAKLGLAKSASAVLGNTINNFRHDTHPYIPSSSEAPLAATVNQALMKSRKEADDMRRLAIEVGDTVEKIGDCARQFLEDFARESGKADKTSSRAIRIAFAALVVTLFQAFYAVWLAVQEDNGHAQAVDIVSRQISGLEEAVRREAATVQGVLDTRIDEGLRELLFAIEGMRETVQGQNSPGALPEQEAAPQQLSPP